MKKRNVDVTVTISVSVSVPASWDEDDIADKLEPMLEFKVNSSSPDAEVDKESVEVYDVMVEPEEP